MSVAADEVLDLANGMVLIVEDYEERERVVVVRNEDERVMSIRPIACTTYYPASSSPPTRARPAKHRSP